MHRIKDSARDHEDHHKGICESYFEMAFSFPSVVHLRKFNDFIGLLKDVC